MVRRPRHDAPGSWHHVGNRGVAKRPIFERTEDVRFFLSRLARAVRRGQIEVHAWSVLTTHFHVLVRSLRGELSEVMARAQNDHSRRFNRIRRRDGPLVRGRFWSKPVRCDAYRRMVVQYIDANAVRAGLVTVSSHHPHGSARWFAQANGPKWHERSWVEGLVCELMGLPRYDPGSYPGVFSSGREDELAYVVERRVAQIGGRGDDLDLFASAKPDVRAWMLRKSRLADNSEPGLPVTGPSTVLAVVAAAESLAGPWRIKRGRRNRDAWIVLRAGLLRDFTGATWSEIASRLSRAPSTASSLCATHASWLREDGEYAMVASDLAGQVVPGSIGSSGRAASASLPRRRLTQRKPGRAGSCSGGRANGAR